MGGRLKLLYETVLIIPLEFDVALLKVSHDKDRGRFPACDLELRGLGFLHLGVQKVLRKYRSSRMMTELAAFIYLLLQALYCFNSLPWS